MIKSSIALLLLASSVFGAQQAPDFAVKIERIARSSIRLTAMPPAGYHFNVAAPMDLLITKQNSHLKPIQARKDQIVFRTPDHGANEYVLSLFLCDEQTTFCERHKIAMNWDAKAASLAAAPSTPSALDARSAALDARSAALKQPASTTKSSLTMLHGFILNNPEAALARARKEKRPLLIDFFGIWCPPCNMLDESVFSSAEFRKASAGFIKLKLDSDSDVSWELKGRYRVSGYPTVILATAEGDEISRVVGFRPRALFVKDVTNAWNSRSRSFIKLKELAEAGDSAAAAKVGLIHLSRREYALAESYLAKAPDQKEALADAQVGVLSEKADAGDKGAEEKLIETLEQATSAYPNSFDTIERRQKLAETYESRKQADKQAEQLKLLIASAEKFAADPARLAGHDAIPGDLYETIAEAYEKLGKTDEAHRAYRMGYEAYGKELSGVARGKSADTERGYNLERAHCLWKGGDAPAADALYSTLERRFPHEFTFYFSHARMNYDLKKIDVARNLVLKAYQYSYGDNKLRAAQLLGKIYDAADKPKEGLAFVRDALKTVKLPDDKSIRTHRYFKLLQEIEQKLAQRL